MDLSVKIHGTKLITCIYIYMCAHIYSEFSVLTDIGFDIHLFLI